MTRHLELFCEELRLDWVKKIRTTMHGAVRTDDESTDEYYVVQWINELYTLQEYKEMTGYIPPLQLM